jgi:YbbR domain-containing protein
LRTKRFLSRALAFWPVKILALAAAVLLFVFNRMSNLEQLVFELPLEVILPDGYVLADPLRTHAVVTVRGEVDGSLRHVTADQFRAYVDLTRFRREGTFVATVAYGRRDAAQLADAFVDRVEPTEVTVSLERVAERSLPVVANIAGSPEKGYSLSQYTITPPVVRLRGPRTVVENTTSVMTEEIDLQGITGDYKTRIGLVHSSPLVSFVGPSRVEFYGLISKVVVTRELVDVPLTLVNADGRYEWEVRPAFGRLVLRGPEVDLDGPEAVAPRLFVDLRDAAARQNRVVPRPEVPEGVRVVEFEPREVIAVRETMGRP